VTSPVILSAAKNLGSSADEIPFDLTQGRLRRKDRSSE